MVYLYAGAVTGASGDGLDRSTVAPIDSVNKAGGLIDWGGMRGCKTEGARLAGNAVARPADTGRGRDDGDGYRAHGRGRTAALVLDRNADRIGALLGVGVAARNSEG